MSAIKKAIAGAQDVGRLPPHSVEAEQAVLGGVMLANEAWDDICELVTCADAFYVPAHRVLWKAIQTLSAKSLPFDVVTVADQFSEEEKNFLGLDYLGELARNTPSVANIRVYAQIVRDRYQLRQLSLIGADLNHEALSDGAQGEALVQQAEKRLCALVELRGKDYIPVSETLARTIDQIDTAFNNEGVTGLSTGYADLDKETAGLQPSDLIIVAGRPSMGKTTFGLNLVENALRARGDQPAFLFSLEMPREQLIMRLLASIGRVDLQRLRNGDIEDEDWPKLTLAAAQIKALDDRLIIEDEAGISATALKARARRLARRFGQPSIIMVDYLQLLQEPGRDNRNLEIASISLALKSLAKELQVPVVALSQLNRSVEQRPNKRPSNADLRDSGAIEQDADVIMFVYRDEVYHTDSPDKGVAEIIIGKQRNGPIGVVRLAFNGRCTRFDSLEFKQSQGH
ncbi:MAG: replicative DNA helicase [Pseudomonas sp.]|uniref:Replicative DNA helicase n=1 Tax=Halopseudomonas litoralis TaxID=797277 RepID=A0A1H1VK13_9GAMM|nr:replicative DNA helicase [Halopseudomonas litoralis]SDS85228.1 replicative DNA helicase [Halopseudomonas litoralis]